MIQLAYSGPGLAGVQRSELNLMAVAGLLEADYRTVRKLLIDTGAPPELLRRPKAPHWRLDSHRLIRHFQTSRHPEIAAKLAAALRIPKR